MTPNLPVYTNSTNHSSKALFVSLPQTSTINFLTFPATLLLFLLFSWSGPSLVSWHAHLIYTTFQYRLSYLILFNFVILTIIYSFSHFFTSSKAYDFLIIIYNFLFWVLLLFLSNNFFTLIFLIEVISSLILLLVITSTYSSTFYYNLKNFTNHNYFSNSTPETFLRAIIFFFWTSLLASISLFLFLTLYYMKIVSFEWFLTESIFSYIVTLAEFKTLLTISCSWLIIIFSLFLKCGLPPFYFWKPTFFKGITLHALFFYVFFYYFFLILFILTLFLFYLTDLFYYNLILFQGLLLVTLLISFFIVFESYYIKSFLAVSSILNTTLIFLGLSGLQITDCTLLL